MSFDNKKVSGFAALAAMRAPFQRKAKSCPLSGVLREDLNHKNVKLLRRFVSPAGRILSSRVTGICAKHQRCVAVAVKRARFLALLPYC